MSTSKGAKREKQLCEILDAAGYETYSPQNIAYGDNDLMGLFDVMARRGHHLRFIQVKSNRSQGITQWFEDTNPYYPMQAVTVGFAVCEDYHGWRYAEATVDGYEWVYDGRDNGREMGEGFIKWFRKQVPQLEASIND